VLSSIKNKGKGGDTNWRRMYQLP